MNERILVGTSSWADPGFVEKWYPQGMTARERLPWYSAQFEAVEVNSTFYAIPDSGTVRRWAEVTPDGFTFDVKLHRLLSRHAAPLDSLPKDLREHTPTNERGRVLLEPDLERAVVERTLAELRAAGRGRQAGRLPAAAHAGVRARRVAARRAGRPGRRAEAPPPGGRAAPSRLGAREAAGGDARLVLRARRGLRGRRRPARRPHPDHARPGRGHRGRAGLPAHARAQHRGLPARQVGGRALRLGLLRRASSRRSPTARAGWPRRPARCT